MTQPQMGSEGGEPPQAARARLAGRAASLERIGEPRDAQDIRDVLGRIDELEALIPTIAPAAWEIGTSDGKPPSVVCFTATAEQARFWAVLLTGLPHGPPPGFGTDPSPSEVR